MRCACARSALLSRCRKSRSGKNCPKSGISPLLWNGAVSAGASMTSWWPECDREGRVEQATCRSRLNSSSRLKSDGCCPLVEFDKMAQSVFLFSAKNGLARLHSSTPRQTIPRERCQETERLERQGPRESMAVEHLLAENLWKGEVALSPLVAPSFHGWRSPVALRRLHPAILRFRASQIAQHLCGFLCSTSSSSASSFIQGRPCLKVIEREAAPRF